ncbi:putative glycosyltransferase 6 domain-containing protein 1 [Pteronotus mesoamericanus]|uniref:putative glycosyltransferase 6 domain-containing protein 1 n=1 Tax=Pteronotus mesoamericanus TaxID=1884717 RepID=UPI0023ED1FA4|nr:putative glycosyltransferase 6 domain-containing protein 1 [Pteronotus parnellii mesoamericanus]
MGAHCIPSASEALGEPADITPAEAPATLGAGQRAQGQDVQKPLSSEGLFGVFPTAVPKMRTRSKKKLLLLVSLLPLLLLVERCRRRRAGELRLSDWFHPRNRPDVLTTTGWRAPVIWEGTFDRQALWRHYTGQNLTVGLAVFAAGRTADQYLEPFLRSANKHFLPGYRVVFYVMVDHWYQLPHLQPVPLHTFRVLTISQDSWWPDWNLLRMKSLGEYILSDIRGEVDFLFSMSVDQVFQNDVGVEILGTAVAQLHAWWYFKGRKNLPYERRRRSAACIPFGEGDFFYDGALVGGTPLHVLNLVEAYLSGVAHDQKHGLNSTYERYLNKYFFLHKPTKLLSPEYNWDAALLLPRQVQYVKVLQLAKRGL